MRLFRLLPMAVLPLAALPLAALVFSHPVSAADPAAVPMPDAAGKPADPVVGRVNAQDIHLSDVKAASQGLPADLRGVPMQMLYPMLLGQTVDRVALTIQARKDGLDKDPTVQQAMRRADDEVLQNALLSRDVGPGITDDAIRARYDRDFKDKPGEAEVHARHILVANEADAKKILTQLKGGAKFDDLAKKLSTDPGAQNGGDLGWFKKGDMVPAFAAAAFAMKPGEVSQTPVHTQFGWHVIKVEEVRTAPPQSLEAKRAEIRQQLIAEGVKKAVADARKGLQIEEFMPDGTKLPAEAPPTVAAVPPAPPGASAPSAVPPPVMPPPAPAVTAPAAAKPAAPASPPPATPAIKP